MKVLRSISLWQPWAWAIAHAGKDTENRSWPPPSWLVGSYLAIHASRRWDEESARGLERVMGIKVGRPPVLGAIVAVARVAGVHDGTDDPTDAGGLQLAAPRGRCPTKEHPEGSPWYAPGSVAWLLEDVTAIEPVPCKGAQKLWVVPEAIAAQVRLRWKEARARAAAS